MNNQSRLLYQGFPLMIGLGLAWFGSRILRNESRLLVRQIELEESLKINKSKWKQFLE